MLDIASMLITHVRHDLYVDFTCYTWPLCKFHKQFSADVIVLFKQYSSELDFCILSIQIYFLLLLRHVQQDLSSLPKLGLIDYIFRNLVYNPGLSAYGGDNPQRAGPSQH